MLAPADRLARRVPFVALSRPVVRERIPPDDDRRRPRDQSFDPAPAAGFGAGDGGSDARRRLNC